MISSKKFIKGTPSPRWALFRTFDISKDGDLYLHRLRIVQTPLFGVYLHDIHREDYDPDPHDHPWNFWSLVLRGGYTEEFTPHAHSHRRDLHAWPRWSLHRMKRGEFHRIRSIQPETKTLVFAGKRKDSWGFLTPAGFVHWKTYIG